MATWYYIGSDPMNGWHDVFKVKAASKEDAIRKGREKYRKAHYGNDPTRWECKLIRA